MSLDPGLPGVLQPIVTNGVANSFSYDNSVPGSGPVAISSQTFTNNGSQVSATPTTYTYSLTFATLQTSAQLSAYITGLTPAQLASIQTSSFSGATTTSTTWNGWTSAPVITLTNQGSTSENFSETIYFHEQYYRTALVGGLPTLGGTGVIFTTLTSGFPGETYGADYESAGNTTTTAAYGAFSTPTEQNVTVKSGNTSVTEYKYTWTRTVTSTATTPLTETKTNENTIQNLTASLPAFSNLTFSYVDDPNAWPGGPSPNNNQGNFTAADFTNTVYTTSSVSTLPGSPTEQYLELANNGTPTEPTTYAVHFVNEYAFQITGTLAPYSTGDLQLYMTAVPELTTWAMMLLGFAGLGFAGYRASRAHVALAK